jgi:hypothetical protein
MPGFSSNEIVTIPSCRHLATQILINDLNLIVDVQDQHHFRLEGGIPFLHVVANLVGPEFALPQNLVEFGSAQLAQRWMSGRNAVLAHMRCPQPIGP